MSPGSGRSERVPVKFRDIETVSDTFDWFNDSFVPHVFVTKDYNGKTLPEDEWGRIGSLNKVLGGQKANGDWLTLATQQLLITIITINGELPAYAITKLQLDFNPGGYIEPSSSTTSTLLDQFPDATTIALDVLVLLWLFPWTLISALLSVVARHRTMDRESLSRHLNELLRHAGMAINFWAFPDGWFAIDALRGPIVYAYYITATLSSVTESFEHIASLTVLIRLLVTAAVFVLGLRGLNTFRDHVGLSILTRTIASAVRSFRTFSVIFAVIFVAFASTGTVLFGNSVDEFSSLLQSTKTCVNMLFNNFDVRTIDQIDYSVAYYWSYMSLMTFTRRIKASAGCFVECSIMVIILLGL
ncbi:uncharacterized protein PITG_03174 [Phytophthora infestans T30-4]|uniref:Polycystin cation channel PKD1/PKD2 domain-containing protein n=1 Tax=Phytophthora infestans (strain T30-4) TaxID=403677 RepID=D0MZJ8_PHYIT|nr:uncharacterized protein PITG_03174 [Phytophthora infestans T30-4]EEY65661.1 conserved hypothetical protein [Phytophthora infestans T30-4]|eukprot:XP_002906260.1 conserved hypothetical protein [Phytophthora infestans T30-4]